MLEVLDLEVEGVCATHCESSWTAPEPENFKAGDCRGGLAEWVPLIFSPKYREKFLKIKKNYILWLKTTSSQGFSLLVIWWLFACLLPPFLAVKSGKGPNLVFFLPSVKWLQVVFPPGLTPEKQEITWNIGNPWSCPLRFLCGNLQRQVLFWRLGDRSTPPPWLLSGALHFKKNICA